MEKLKHKFLKVGERIYFGTKKGSVVDRYCDKKKLNLKNNFYLYIEYSDIPTPKNLTVSFIYFDTNAKGVIEYVIQKEILPAINRNPRCEIKLPVVIHQEGKELYKIKFECLPIVETSLYLSISDS